MDDKDQTVLWALQELSDQIERANAAIACAAAAESALAERDKPCVWIARQRKRGTGTMIEPTCKRAIDDFGYISAMEAYPSKFCPNCGHPIEVQPIEVQP